MSEQAVRKAHDQYEQAPSFGNPMNEKAVSFHQLPGLQIYLGIFMVSGSTLLFELALTRIFAVVLWAHLAFMVVGSALFGMGLSGVYLALSNRSEEKRMALGKLCLLLALTMIAAYLVITWVPFRMWHFSEDPLNYLYLAAWYSACVLPFFVAGQVIARILNNYPTRCSRLYGVDLVGAALGSFLLLPVISSFGGVGTLVMASLIASAAGIVLLSRSGITAKGLAIVLSLVLAFVLTDAERYLPLKFYTPKREFRRSLNQKRGIISTRWSAISRVDIARYIPGKRRLWIDGGTNESVIRRWSGDTLNLKPHTYSSIGTVYNLKLGTDPNVLIIGPSGGTEVLFALSFGAENVDAVELDPSIVDLLSRKKHAKFMGYLYQNEKVNLVNDEGRAFLRRKPSNTYDIIQFVNNYTPVAMASGALNLSETFLITKEAFFDFYDRLTENGVVALHRGATLRVALTAIAALRELGIENPESHIVITSGEVPYFEGFFMKKSPWTEEEVKNVYDYMQGRPKQNPTYLIWNPLDPGRDNFYSEVLSSSPEKQKEYFTGLGINLFPATDNRPFIEHFSQFGKKELPKNLPAEFYKKEAKKIWGVIPRGDFPYVVILAESALLALLFVVGPLLLWGRKGTKMSGFKSFLAYYACLGFGFILVEICLMKRYILFLGNPAYSITTILVALLLGAGLGSMFSQRFESNPRRALGYVIPLVVAAILAETFLSPILFHSFLRFDFTMRVLVAIAMLLPLGFLMGMPFPTGLQLLNKASANEEARRTGMAWMWGINGYMTVVGSAMAVFIALLGGFKSVLGIGVITYGLALFFIWLLGRQLSKA